MKRNILYLLSIGICLFTCVGSHAAAPETRAHLERGRSLFDHGRWTDARYELLKAREGADRDDRLTLQQIDYQLAVCALKLGSRDVEAMLADFSKRYPESVYNNDLRFAQGLLYCSRSEYDKALACFGRVNYRALDRTRREQYDLRMGYIEFGRDDYDRAMTYFDRINPQSEFYDHALYYKSYIAYAREQYDWARSGFERLLKSEAYGEVAPYYLLQIEFKQGNYRYVVENGEELIRRASPRQRAELSRVMAEAWFRLGEYSKPLDYLDAFVQAGGEMGRDDSPVPVALSIVCASSPVSAQGVRSRRRSDAERLLPLGRLLLARRGQAAGDAVVRHGFECRIRFRDCRRRAVQLWKIAIRTGRRTFQRSDSGTQPLCRPVSVVAPCTHGQRVVGGGLLQFAQLRRSVRDHRLLSRSRRRPAGRQAEDRLFPRLERTGKGRYGGGRALSGGVRPYRNQSQIQCAGNLLAG